MTTPQHLSDRYELGEILGFGGMSEVHLARDVRLHRVHVANGVEELDCRRPRGGRGQLRRDEAAQRLTGAGFMRGVFACGGAVVVRGVPVGKVGVVGQVAVGRLSGQENSGARRSYRDSNQRERKSKMGQGAKQAHGREALTRYPTAMNTAPSSTEDPTMAMNAVQLSGSMTAPEATSAPAAAP